MIKALRFGIGEPNLRRSTVWKLWTNKNDVYLASRVVGSELKVSLHELGSCQFSRTFESLANTGMKNRDRHLQRWQRRPVYAESGVVHLFRIIFPESELRLASAGKGNVPPVNWHPAPPLNHGAYVELWLTRRLPEAPTNLQFMNELLGVLNLVNGQYLGVTVRSMKISPADHDQIKGLKAQITAENPSYGREGWGWALTLSSDMVHAIVEFALWPNRPT